jgi:hypothetical protein
MISYEEFVSALVKPGKDIAKNITPEEANLWHLATGAAGEGGEPLDAVKKHVIYKKELDRENIIEELGILSFIVKESEPRLVLLVKKSLSIT